MKFVVDTNILFSFFWEESLTKKLLVSSRLDLISPEYSLTEIKKYSKDIMKKTGMEKKLFDKNYKMIKNFVNFVGESEYNDFIDQAVKISPDKKDSHFLALSMKKDCYLWSNDKILRKQGSVKVLSTEEIIEVLF